MRKLRQYAYFNLLAFSFLGILFIPFSFRLPNPQSKITKFLFEDLILNTASFFDWIQVTNPEVSSDSTTLYVLVFLLMCLAIILTTTFSFFDFWRKHRLLILRSIQLVLTFYLSIIMLKYGFDKIFKAQFYLPEPNTLYTPLGMMDKDLLYWSTMGTSYSYNLFMGFSEVIPAVLLLFSRTRTIGLLILSGVLTNVVFINLGFDISVKLYSSFLLLLCLLLLAPSFKTLLHFLILKKPAVLEPMTGKSLVPSTTFRMIFKTAIILLFFAEAVFPYIQKGNFNDDNMPRGYLHGAYEVIKVENELADNIQESLNLERIFIHRHDYLIFQYEDDTMEDFQLEINSDRNQLILTNYDEEKLHFQFSYSETTKSFVLKSDELDMTIYTESLPWKDLPLLQPLFHWSVDGV